MKITKHIIEPSYHRNPDFKSGELTANFNCKCANCDCEMTLSFETAQKACLETELELSKEEKGNLKDIYKIGYVGKSHDGGWPHFINLNCINCSQSHIVYLGVQEPVNSCLHITVQAVSSWK